MSHDKLNYIEIMHSKGHRVTPQRLTLLDAICEAQGHTTVGEIYARARQKDPRIDRSTVYRTLDLFTQLGLVVSAEIEEGEKVYEIIKQEPHHHLICQSCGAEVEIQGELVQDFYDMLGSAHQYRVEMDHLIVFGLCPDCAKK